MYFIPHVYRMEEVTCMDIVKLAIERVLYPLMEKRKGNRVRANIRELQASERLPPDSMDNLRVEKLTRLLHVCADKVPAFADLKDRRNAIDSDPAGVLQSLPILTKALYMKNPDAYVADGTNPATLIKNRSGGSTSESITFYMDRHTVEYYEAARWRGLSWYGITPGSRCVMIWGNPLEMDQYQFWKYRMKERWLKNRIAFPAYSLKPEVMPGYLATINRYRPEYLYGYSSALYTFAVFMQERDLKLKFVPKAVVSTSETLHDWQRERISDVFGCQVVNEYGARDGGMLAYQCPEGSMHICVENIWLELVDEKTGKPVGNKETGLVLVTDLNNLVQPRLRYRVGDRATRSDAPCACGRDVPILGAINDREDDMFLRVDGQYVHGHAFNHVARAMGVLQKFQIVQEAPERAVLRMVPKAGTTRAEITRFTEAIQALLPGTAIQTEEVEDIPPMSSGKYRYAIRRFPL